MPTTPVEVVFSFDTTGSMYPCLTQVRRKIKETVNRLAKEVPGIRVGIIAHGDYCDRNSTYVTKHLDLTDRTGDICKFVQTVGATGGGDAPECYELVLHEAQSLSWSKGASKAMVLIGDDVPHPPNSNPKKLDWRKEVDKLADLGVPVYGVQALNRGHATRFYQTLARKSGGFHITLDQFSYVTDLVLAVCFKQNSDEHLKRYEAEVKTAKRMSRGLNKIFDTMFRRKPSRDFAARDLHAVPPGRFQVLDVDDDASIREFVEENGLNFKPGRGFYEFTKSETVQGYKEIILMERATGDLFAGEKARELLGLPDGETARIKPSELGKYAVFVQSTSYNRRLVGGTRFLYEVEDWDREEESEPTPTTKAKPIATVKKKAVKAKPGAKTKPGVKGVKVRKATKA